jgi:hypothetical protein
MPRDMSLDFALVQEFTQSAQLTAAAIGIA